MFSDSSSIMGDRWYDNNKKGIDFKFEVNSAVDSIEFPMNQNLNLKLDSKSVDGDLNLQIQLMRCQLRLPPIRCQLKLPGGCSLIV